MVRRRPLIFLIAGEPSGDAIGARLMAAISRQSGGEAVFAGVGGAAMEAQGLDSLFPMHELSLMGAAELLPHLPRLLRRIRLTADTICRVRPDVVVSIDVPGFAFRVEKRLQGEGIPLVHYVAPQVWAWKPGRAREIAGFLDHLMVLLPFEPRYFEVEGLPCTFVGHPVLETASASGDGAGFRRCHGIAADAPLLCVLPGSRRGEVRRLLPAFAGALSRLADTHPGLRVVVPAVPHLQAEIAAQAETWAVSTVVIAADDRRYDAFVAADAALAASGTVALELAMAGTPMVIAYRLNPVTGWLARRVLKIEHVNLINLILGQGVIPELLQQNCRPDRLADAVGRLLDDGEARAAQRRAARQALETLKPGGALPSERAAEVVLAHVGRPSRFPVTRPQALALPAYAQEPTSPAAR
ncbi:MAG: lipid-A-disaccharide synthase [Rhodospirillales bacterium]|nr:MAG: lipid-A-disaccharide synthase [Rhodospirillales bacterium]